MVLISIELFLFYKEDVCTNWSNFQVTHRGDHVLLLLDSFCVFVSSSEMI